MKFYVATYGDMGIEVEFFRADQLIEYNEAVNAASEQHGVGELDTYTYGEIEPFAAR